MVYNPSAPMFRHHQQHVPNPAPHHPTASWYPGYHHHHQSAPIQTSGNPYCMHPEEQNNVWPHHHPPVGPHGAFANDYSDFMGHNFYPLAPTAMHPGIAGAGAGGGGGVVVENQLPSPPITGSGSEMSSPGAGTTSTSPGSQNMRPAPARSPYEWIKKPSYQSQPNPGKTRTKDKYRVVYTDHQRMELEKEFTFQNKYITIRRKTQLAESLGLSERQIKIWFQNRRAKERKQIKKRAEEKNGLDIGHQTDHVMPQYQNLVQQHHHQQMMQQPQAVTETGPVLPQLNIMHNHHHHQQISDHMMKLELNDEQLA